MLDLNIFLVITSLGVGGVERLLTSLADRYVAMGPRQCGRIGGGAIKLNG